MLRRLRALFLRYAAVHEDRVRSVAFGPIGRRWGQVEKVSRHGDQVKITGWSNAKTLRVSWPNGTLDVARTIHRADVAATANAPADVGFEVSVPASARPLTFAATAVKGARETIEIPHPSDPPTRLGQRRLRRAFLRDILRAAPALVGCILRPSDRTKTDVKRALRLDVATRGHQLDAAWLGVSAPCPVSADGITIILPIFNALPLLRKCLARVEAHTDLPWHLILVNDASTDPAVQPMLEKWASKRVAHVTICEQRVNKGFVASVNLGLAAVRDGHGPIVLLNSDAMVPSGWASRLVTPLADTSVASVTPMSNAAEILSVPAIGPGVTLNAGEVDQIDTVAKTLGSGIGPDLPTGVGFCMALSRSWLARVPTFDPAFGRGYGEEVDWCQKTRALGAQHLCQPRLFVEHVGGQSFGSAEKKLRLRSANAIISRRYAGYDADVQKFIADDPLATPRLAMAVALAGQRTERLCVFLAHSLGGGAETALMAEVENLEAAVILRVGGPRRWQLEVHVEGQCVAGQTDDLALVQRILAPVEALDLIYSCGVGDPDPVTLPDVILSLRRPNSHDQIGMRFHDYFPLSPSYTILGENGYEGVPADTCRDAAHLALRPDGSEVSLREWRGAWGKIIDVAQEVTVFSRASETLVRQAYPGAQIHLKPHCIPNTVRAIAPANTDCIGLLGNLNRQKGANILRLIAERHTNQDFVVIGQVDATFALPKNVRVHGAYSPPEISDLAERYGIGRWLFPSIWPETFSFAVREALATGLPVAGFALGAQGEALQVAPNGFLIPLDPQETAPERLFAAIQSCAMQEIAAE